MKRFLVRIFVFCGTLALILEAFFRVVVPACSVAYTVYNPEFAILQLDKSKTRVGCFTSGRLAQFKSHWRVNNYGWNSGANYVSSQTRRKPSIAVIGDSFIEGYCCDWKDHVATRLQELTKDSYDVYSFGISGATLMQYVNMARYVSHHFDPDIFIFRVGSGKVEDSVGNYGRWPLQLQLKYEDDHFVELPPIPYVPDPKKRLLRQSAIIRYLLFNAKVNLLGGQLVREGSAQQDDEFGDGIGFVTSGKQHVLRMAARYIVEKLRIDHPGKTLVFVIDADRGAIYESPEPPKRLYDSFLLEEACKQHGGDFVDLTEAFHTDYREQGRKFDFEFDDHWNAYGNFVVANTVYDYLVRRQLLCLPETTG